jgi:hypothetical protein
MIVSFSVPENKRRIFAAVFLWRIKQAARALGRIPGNPMALTR